MNKHADYEQFWVYIVMIRANIYYNYNHIIHFTLWQMVYIQLKVS